MAPRTRKNQDFKRSVELFIEESVVLFQHPLWDTGWSPKLTISWDTEKGNDFGDNDPPCELFESYLLKLRPFLSQKEPQFVYRVYNIVYKSCTDEEFKAELSQERDEWQTTLRGGGMQVIENNRKLLPDDAWNAYVNAVYFHRDQDLRSFLADLHEFTSAAVRYQFHQHVYDATVYINNLGVIIKEGLDSSKIVLPQA